MWWTICSLSDSPKKKVKNTAANNLIGEARLD